jgi:hypothetical protein
MGLHGKGVVLRAYYDYYYRIGKSYCDYYHGNGTFKLHDIGTTKICTIRGRYSLKLSYEPTSNTITGWKYFKLHHMGII